MSDSLQRSFLFRNQTFSAPPLEAGLYLVSTPIGNLGDITIRALETLAACSVIACEDTRTSGILLKRFGISNRKISYTEHNADHRGAELLERIQNGEAVCIISDAGTPLVSDPGFRLVQRAAKLDLNIVPIPGASAPMTALVASGLGAEDFRFIGFLPTKNKAKTNILESVKSASSTLIFFESPARIANSLKIAADVFGSNRRACVARELTKMHETFYRAQLGQLAEEFDGMERVRGEIVWMVEGAADEVPDETALDEQLAQLLTEMKPGAAASLLSAKTGLSRQDLYKRAMALKDAR